ncbi:MAG: chromosomal replication initiator protein DnaA [Hyphomicrobiaceae bacterium]
MTIESKDNLSAAMLETQQDTAVTQGGGSKSANRDQKSNSLKTSENKIRAVLRARLGEEVYSSWFSSMEFEAVEGDTIQTSVPVKFLRNWIQNHYLDDVLAACQTEFPDAERIEVSLRQPVGPKTASPASAEQAPTAAEGGAGLGQAARQSSSAWPATPVPGADFVARTPTQAAGFEGSPLDPRYTFDSFIVGSANRMAHAGASQVADTIFSESRGFNPLYLHSAVGLGKTHLLQAVAWEVRRRMPQAQILYLTAERFRFSFVEALQSKEAMAFKDRFRSIDMLLIDDLEFLHGQHTEIEFDHIINALLDGGRQVVVASARAPNQIEKLNERMRSRLQRGLVTEISAPDYDLRLKILERRIQEKRQMDPSFEISRDVIELLAERLVENGRELEGATARLHAHWQYLHSPITCETAETVVRDLFQNGGEPRRVRIEEIIKTVSRHFGVSKPDILSQRRHRSVVWPRQIGMYLSKQLTARSLPEIGRRFGNRDHTTVLHAIRKIDKELDANPRLRDELEDLKKMLSS